MERQKIRGRKARLVRPEMIAGPSSARRKRMGWMRPIVCPKCRQYTRQVRYTRQAKTGKWTRRCLSCSTTFSRTESRRVKH